MTNTPASFDLWVTCPLPNPHARLRLFCFPYAGGGASIFRTWHLDLPTDIEICPIQLPGRERRLREPSFTQLPALLETLAQVLRPHLNTPFALFGHSMGGLISFELARKLRNQYDLEPVHLFISGHRSPQLPDLAPPLHRLPEDLFVEELRHLGGTPETVLQNPELIKLLLPILHTDFSLCETYVYSSEAPLDCPISAFGGLQDGKVSYEDLAAWRDQTNSSFKLSMFPGNHFFLQSARSLMLSAMTQDLIQFLNQA